MKNVNSFNYILKAVCEYANISLDEMKDESVLFSDGLFEVSFCTDWMSYICYVDMGGQILGFMSEPVELSFEHSLVTLSCEKCA